jgi:hypothetical protein
MTRKTTLLLFAFATLAGCSGKTTDDTSDTHAQLVARVNAAACSSAKPTAVDPSATPASLASDMTGTWLACDRAAASALFPASTLAGFQVTSDGHVNAVDVDDSGAYVQKTGFVNEATASFVVFGGVGAAPGQQQLSVTYYDDSMLPLHFAMSKDKSTLDLLDYYGNPVTFVASSAMVGAPALPKPGASLGAAACGGPEGDLLPRSASEADTTAAIVGKWVQCAGAPKPEHNEFGPSGNAGIEIDGDGTWAFLRGDFTKGTEDGWRGLWQLVSTGASAEGPPFQLNLDAAAGGTYTVVWAAAAAPRKLRLEVQGDYASIYSAMP